MFSVCPYRPGGFDPAGDARDHAFVASVALAINLAIGFFKAAYLCSKGRECHRGRRPRPSLCLRQRR